MRNIDDLRETLFDTLESVRSGDMPLDRAKAINEISQTIINAAKAEVDFARATGEYSANGFIPIGHTPKTSDPKPTAIRDPLTSVWAIAK